MTLSPTPQGTFDPKTAGHIADVIITALEGGINRWIKSAKIEGQLPARASQEAATERYARLLLQGHWSIRLELDETPVDGMVPYVHLNLPGLLWGIEVAAQRSGKSVQNWLANHDAGDADNAVQLAIFGHLIFD